MFKRTFAFLAVAFALFGTQCWACDPCTSITNTFSPTVTTNTYDFSGSGDGRLIVQFETVLTTFNLTVTVNHTIDAFDPNEFPAGTLCVTYSTNSPNACDQYDFSGNALTGGFDGVPVRNQDYKGLITLTLSYASNQSANDPAFAHAPDGSATFTENILTVYFSFTCVGEECDPTMGGKTPNLSSVLAAAEPLTESDTFCFVSPQPNQTVTVGQEVDVTFQLFSGVGGPCPNTGTPLRDKTAVFSLSLTDSNGNFISYATLRDKEEGNKFHWDHKAGVNEFDLSTVGLAPGNYTITLISSKFSPQSVPFVLNPAP
jgi:hypothetical protein